MLKGRAHRGDKLQLKTRDQDIFEVTVDQDGMFKFGEIRLYDKTNTITIFNPTLESRGVSDSGVSVNVYYDSSLAPYFNRTDPITKISLATAEVFEIVGCRTCGNYQLLESWIFFGNRCTLSQNCQGNQFWEAQDDKFWQP